MSPKRPNHSDRSRKKNGKRHRQHQRMSKQIDDLSDALFAMQNAMVQRGIINTIPPRKRITNSERKGT